MSPFPEAAIIANRLYMSALFEDFVLIICVCMWCVQIYVVDNLWVVRLWSVRVSTA